MNICSPNFLQLGPLNSQCHPFLQSVFSLRGGLLSSAPPAAAAGQGSFLKWLCDL